MTAILTETAKYDLSERLDYFKQSLVEAFPKEWLGRTVPVVFDWGKDEESSDLFVLQPDKRCYRISRQGLIKNMNWCKLLIKPPIDVREANKVN